MSETFAYFQNLKIHSFPHRFTLSLILQGVERYPLRRYPAIEPQEKARRDCDVEKAGWTFSMVQSCEKAGVL